MSVKLSIHTVLYTDDEMSVGKVAMALSMVGNDFDELITDLVNSREGFKGVITRAGGTGDNLKNKILRNALTAAEKSGVIKENAQNRYALTQCIEKALRGINSTLTGISGAGIKIGISSKNRDLAVALFGIIGIPGLDVDQEVCGLGTLSHCLSN